jgi:hypothetical protein
MSVEIKLWKSQRIANGIQFSLLIVALIASFLAYRTWRSEIEKRKVEITLKYLEPLTQKDYINGLWAVQTFTICLEKQSKFHLSYLTSHELDKTNKKTIDLAAKWWHIIENSTIENKCRTLALKRYGVSDLEFELFQFSSKMIYLAACLRSELCDIGVVRLMSEGGTDIISPTAISNYIRLSSQYSREWNSSNNDMVWLSDKFFEWSHDFTIRAREKIWEEADDVDGGH